MATMTIPVKNNLDSDRGSIVLSVSDIAPKENMHLLTLGAVSLLMDSIENENTLYIVKNNNQLTDVRFEGKDIDVIVSWENEQVWLSVYSQETLPQHLGSTDKVMSDPIFGDVLSLFEGNYFNGSYQHLTIYTQPLALQDLSSFSLEVFKETTEELFDADFTQPTHYKRDVVIEDTFAPRDGSPILIEDDKGPLYRQFFFDEETSEYQNEVVEHFTYRNEDYQRLAYSNIEPGYKVKIVFPTESGNEIFYENIDFEVRDQQIFFWLSNEMRESLYGLDYTVTYQLNRSYNIDFNEDVPHDGFRVNLVNMKAAPDGDLYSSTENIRMIREGNRFEQEYLAKEIELNPLVNPQVQGFMYIDTAKQYTQAFRITASSQYLNGNGVDTASVMIEAIDEEGNEVLSPYLTVRLMNEQGDISTGFGKVEPIVGYQSMKARNTSGRAYYEFRAPVLTDDQEATHRVYILAYDRRTGVGAQFPIYIRSVKEEQAFDIQSERTNYSHLPFEYFARMFERELPEDHPIWALDYNGNHRLDREDMAVFENQQHNQSFLQTLTEDLIAYEKAQTK